LENKKGIDSMNELSAIPNPDNIPGAVSTGYQRQNTNIFVLQTGFDSTTVTDNGSSITIQAGGVVEINGVLFKVFSTTTLSKPSSSYSYWVAVTDNGDGTASFSLVNRPGVWVPDKNGYYLNNARILNWSESQGIPQGSLPSPIFTRTTKGIQNVSLKKGKYYFELRSGLGGGNGSKGADGANTNTSKIGGNGGTPSSYNSVNIIKYFDIDTTVTVKVGGNGYPGGKGGDVISSGTNTARGGAGGGGGGGGGEATEVVGIISTEPVIGGNGGNGGAGWATSNTMAGAGGGGGGGYVPGAGGASGNANWLTAGSIGEMNHGYFAGARGGYGGDAPGLEQNPGKASGGYGGAALNLGINWGTTFVFNGTGGDPNGSVGNNSTSLQTGASGGGQGAGGEARENNGAGGYCRIYKLD
jgi:hypothetical protein